MKTNDDIINKKGLDAQEMRKKDLQNEIKRNLKLFKEARDKFAK